MNSVKERLKALKEKQKFAEKLLKKYSHYWAIGTAGGIIIGIVIFKLQLYMLLPLLAFNYWQIYRGLKRYQRLVKRYDDICDEIKTMEQFVSIELKLEND
ncbi:hypothetical protein, partial [Bacillus cereus]|uniref:hypothetical protein n=1 Tax=Bacillus cereus TaxID=1396 RepID=UPI001124EA41